MNPAQNVRGTFALLALLVIAALTACQATSAAPDGNLKSYMPIVRNSGQATPTVPPTPTTTVPATPTTPPGTNSGALYITTAVESASASAQIDANGGMHAAFVHFTSAPDPSPAVYARCTAPGTGCDNPANWTQVTLADGARDVQLQLTADGQPRLLIVANSTVYTTGKDYLYAECNNACTTAANWRVTLVASSDGTSIFDVNDQNAPQRSFALDNQGRPAFVYFDRNYLIEPDHIGVYYTFCASACYDSGNWHQTNIGRTFPYDYETFAYPALAFTANGAPRILSRVFALNDDGSDAPEGLYYYACDANCGIFANWQRLNLFYPGSGSYPLPAWDIAVDTAGAPHVAFFTGGGADGNGDFDYQLIYLTCTTACLDGNNWHGTVLGLPLYDGQGPDIELDNANRPRIAFMYDYDNLGYAWCDNNCAAAYTSWQTLIVETPDEQEADNPQAIPPHCDQDLWQGLTPSLAFDAAGNPRIAHDITVDARCTYEDPDDPGNPIIRFERVWNGVRWNFFPHP